MLIENCDYFIRLVPFPPGADGAVMTNDDGTYSIYIDANATREQQNIALRHELRHIEHVHFYSDMTIDQIEAEASAS